MNDRESGVFSPNTPNATDNAENINIPPTRRASVKFVADELSQQMKCNSKDKPYGKMLLSDEIVVLDGIVIKRSGWSFKSRILVLTNKPRLMYFTTSGDFKGLIPWSMTEPIDAYLVRII